MHELIDDIERRVQSLAPQLPGAFYTDVTELSSSVGRLRRIARVAVDAAQDTTAQPVAEKPQENASDSTPEHVEAAAAVQASDEWGFAGLVEPFRREVQVHCYRMVGSYDDAEDLVQEVFLRAWRRRAGFAGRASLRSWLYRIATNACLDFLRRTNRQPQRYEPVPGLESGATEGPARITWLQPYPDQLLDDVVSAEETPDDAAVSRETLELVFLTAIQHLPPQQRAVLLLRDVLGWPAADAAEQLEMSVASVNSALQRARPTLREHLPDRRAEWTAASGPTAAERAILERYITVAQRGDLDSVAELLTEETVLTMPPNPYWFVGRDAIINFLRPVFTPGSPSYLGEWRSVPTAANRQPAVGNYLRRTGTNVYRAQVLDVLRIEGGKVVQITSFEPHLFPAFGLSLTL